MIAVQLQFCVILQVMCVCVLFLHRLFTAKALSELERFHSQKESDFKSILINYVQLQAHIHRKVSHGHYRVVCDRLLSCFAGNYYVGKIQARIWDDVMSKLELF